MRPPIRIVLTGILVFLSAGVSAHAQSITSFNVPDAFLGTTALSINERGEVTGYYEAHSKERGFIRDARGRFTTFDVPGSLSTAAQSINNRGEVTGYYGDPVTFRPRGFIRDARGTFTTFDVPGSLSTAAQSINNRGEVTGYYGDPVTFRPRGFIRDARGTFTTFDVPGSFLRTFPRSINDAGEITGFYQTVSGSHGFIRD